jgi:hypothetical protein
METLVEAKYKALVERVYRYCLDYVRVYKTDSIPYRNLAARFGKSMSSTGRALDIVIKNDVRFNMIMSGKSGGYTVRLLGDRKLEELIFNALTDAGGALSDGDLRARLNGTGFTVSDYMDSVMTMQADKRIVSNEGVHRLI